MNYETVKHVMTALAAVAEAVGNLRALFPAGCDIVDEVAQKVTEVSDRVLEDAMLGAVGSPERTGRWEDGAEALLRKAERELAHGAPHAVATQKAKAVKPRKTSLGRAAAKAENAATLAAQTGKAPEPGADGKPEQVMRVCPDCGASYLRTGRNQKRCKACGDAKTKEA